MKHEFSHNPQSEVVSVVRRDGDAIHRYELSPDMDVSAEPEEVRVFCSEVWGASALAGYETFVAANTPPPSPPRRVGSPREFLRLFTAQEKAAFFTAAKQSVELELWWIEASSGGFSLDHPSVPLGLDALVGLGILNPARKGEILASDFDVG